MYKRQLGGARGQASDIRIQADEILFLKERLNSELSERTGKDLSMMGWVFLTQCSMLSLTYILFV